MKKELMHEGDGNFVIMEIDTTNTIYMDMETLTELMINITEFDRDKFTIGVEYEDDGTLSGVVVFVEDESAAKTIEERLNKAVKEDRSILLRKAKIRVEAKKLELSVSQSFYSGSISLLIILLTVLLLS